ncbi:MAG: lipase [Gammaproteobacteria bacterium]|nr:MAG: lipase [Gammaproteobacteria bacterium]
MNIRKAITPKESITAITFITALVAGNAIASSHDDYVSFEDCSWWDFTCKNEQSDNRYNTQYPIVLVHGLSGFEQILFVEYFHGIPSELRDGNAKVYTPNLSSWNGIEVRGEQLVDYIQNHVLPDSGASKVNLIGHSMGSPTSRYVASVYPEIVASVTSVHGANSGSHFSDFMMYQLLPEDSPLYDLYIDITDGLLSTFGSIIDFLSSGEHYEQDAFQATWDLSSEGAAAFNEKYPEGQPTSDCSSGAEEVNGIRYYSWGGIGGITNIFDPLDYAMTFIGQATANGADTDGLVGRCEQMWGNVLRDDYNHNHTDGSNLLFGMTGFTDAKDIYENHANRLRSIGL